uniref:Uncharacterized protein n=1 Tax=Octopus bimaculoides TaxID=37653 RepID=A0A0L8IEJ3_OCTBM
MRVCVCVCVCLCNCHINVILIPTTVCMSVYIHACNFAIIYVRSRSTCAHTLALFNGRINMYVKVILILH